MQTTALTGRNPDTSLEHLDGLAVLRGIRDQAMARLYDKYAKSVFTVSLRIVRDPATAEDVLQEVFLRIWCNPERIFLGTSLLPWLTVVSRNRSIDIVRKRRWSEPIDEVELAGPHDLALEAEQNLLCAKASVLISELSPLQRGALEMAYFKGMTHPEIAAATGIPLGTIKTRIRDALTNLRRSFGTEGLSTGRIVAFAAEPRAN